MGDHFGKAIPMGNTVCALDHTEKMDLLLRSGYNVNLSNETLMPAIWWSLKRCNVDMARKLIDAKSEWLSVTRKLGRVQRMGYHIQNHHGTSLQNFLQRFPVKYTTELLNFLYKEQKLDIHEPVRNPGWAISSVFLSLPFEHTTMTDESCPLLKFFIDFKIDLNSVVDAEPDDSLKISLGYNFGASRSRSMLNFLLDGKMDPLGNMDHPLFNKVFYRCFLDRVIRTANRTAVGAYADWVAKQQCE